MFFSMVSSWKSAAKELSDVRELIPEFYYLSEVFFNREGLNLGTMQSGKSSTTWNFQFGLLTPIIS